MYHRTCINNNIDELCNLSFFGLKFFLTCRQEKVINLEEYNTLVGVKADRDSYVKNSEFYHILHRKDFKTFQRVVEIMKQEDIRQSDDVLRILDQVSVNGQTNGNAPIVPVVAMESLSIANGQAPQNTQQTDYSSLVTQIRSSATPIQTINLRNAFIDTNTLLPALAECVSLQNLNIEQCVITNVVVAHPRIFFPELKSVRMDLYKPEILNIQGLSEYAESLIKPLCFFYNNNVGKPEWQFDEIWDLKIDLAISINGVNILTMNQNPAKFTASYINSYSQMFKRPTDPQKLSVLALNRVQLEPELKFDLSLTNLVLCAIDLTNFENFTFKFPNLTNLSVCNSRRQTFDLFLYIKDLKCLKILRVCGAAVILSTTSQDYVMPNLEEIHLHESSLSESLAAVPKHFPNLNSCSFGEYNLGSSPPLQLVKDLLGMKNMFSIKIWWFAWSSNPKALQPNQENNFKEIESFLKSKCTGVIDYQHQYFVVEKSHIDRQWQGKLMGWQDLLNETHEKFQWPLFWKDYATSWKYWA